MLESTTFVQVAAQAIASSAMGSTTRTQSFNGAKLRKLREAAGLSRRALGDRVSKSQLTIGQYERGRTVPSAAALAGLAAALGSTIDSLFDVAFEVEEHARVGA